MKYSHDVASLSCIFICDLNEVIAINCHSVLFKATNERLR